MVKHGQITRRQLPARILESFAKLFNIFGCLKIVWVRLTIFWGWRLKG